MLNLKFVLATDVLSFAVHCVDVGLIAIRKLVHALDQIVTLVRQVLQLLIHQRLLLPRFDLLIAESIELIGKLSEAARSLLVLVLEGAEVVRPAHQVSIDGVGLPLDLLAEFLLFFQFCKEAFLLSLEAVQVLSQFLI